MTHPLPDPEAGEDGPSDPEDDQPLPQDAWDKDDPRVLDGEYSEEEPQRPQYDPTVAPLAPLPQPIGGPAVIGTFLGVAAFMSCIWFAIQNNWPAVIPSVLVLIGLGLIGLRMVRGPIQDAEYRAALVTAEPILDPSPRVERCLSPGERLYIETHEHPLSITPWVLLALLATVGAGWLVSATTWQTGAISWGIAMSYCIYRMALWERRVFCVTDRYIILIEGVFTTHENRMHIIKVTDAKKVVPLHSKMLAWLRMTKLSYGTFYLETAGQEQAINKVGWLPNINQLTRITMALASGNRPDLPPEY